MLASLKPGFRHNFGSDYAMLHLYLGEMKFAKLMRDHRTSWPAEKSNARWLSQQLPDHVATYAPFKPFPEIHELAIFERAFNSAFEAIDIKAATPAEFENINSHAEAIRSLRVHPSAALLTFTQNTTSIWSALRCDEKPPRPHHLDIRQKVIVWRQSGQSRFRIVGLEEAQIFDQVKNGASFKAISKTIRDSYPKDFANKRALIYLRGWLEAELILAPDQSKGV